MAQLGTSLAGLDEATAEVRLAEHGANEVAHEHRKSAVRRLLELFLTPLSVLLLALATVNYFTGEVKGAIVIAVMVVLSSLLSFMQEFRSSKAAERLRAMVSTTATVFRKEVSCRMARPERRGTWAGDARRPDEPCGNSTDGRGPGRHHPPLGW